MSVSLIVIRLETASDHPQLQHIQFQDSDKTLSKATNNSGVGGGRECDVEVRPSEWPLLVSDTLLAMHRGQRCPAIITVTTLDADFIDKEMAAYEQTSKSCSNGKQQQHLEDAQCSDEGIVIPKEIGEEQEEDEYEATGEARDDFIAGAAGRWCSHESTPAASSSKEGTPGPSDDASQASGSSGLGGGRQRIPFLSGNPTVDVTHGILHLYKQNSKTPLSDGEERSSMLCLLAVPSAVTIHDLLQFSAPCYAGILHLRIIRDSSPSQYMVLVKFRSQAYADEFYTNFNDRPYNTLEPDVLCKLVYVARVETTTDAKEGGLPLPGHAELPTCPVCLERMDESLDGVLTILCNHSFHGECLAKWGDTSCPVCRYCQTVEADDQTCSQCGARDSLWICLICGHVGCGRYISGHAHRHFMETNHLFSMQLGNNRVWDYVRDNYVHRLLQSEGDGKVVSYERAGADGNQCGGGDGDGSEGGQLGGGGGGDTKEELVTGDEKLSTLQLEYTHLLSSQLESQRQYFEDKMAELVTNASAETEASRSSVQEVERCVAELQRQVAAISKEKQHAERRTAQLSAKLSKVSSELETEQQLNANLRQSKKEGQARLDEMREQLTKKNEAIAELEAQVRDLLVHLDAATSVAGNPELQGASVTLPQPTRARGRRRR